MAMCHVEPQEKRAFVGAVGKELVRRHGKKKYYRTQEISDAALALCYPVDIHCWALAFFATPSDFAALHAATGEACDYAVMRASLLTDLADGGTWSWFDIDLSWLDWPDIDLSSAFDWFDLSP